MEWMYKSLYEIMMFLASWILQYITYKWTDYMVLYQFTSQFCFSAANPALVLQYVTYEYSVTTDPTPPLSAVAV